jgi:probable HAF family extracellular repeat protein
MHVVTRTAAHIAMLSVCLVLSGCSDTPTSPDGLAMQAAVVRGKTSGPVVAAVQPNHGRQGETGKQVTITGSGFVDGSTVEWQRGGVVDPGVSVRSVVFVSSSQLDATIDIAADAAIAFYDVVVRTPDKKQGIGTESFEVTQAISIGTLDGSAWARGVNDAGQIVGYAFVGNTYHAFHWSSGTGMVDLGAGIAQEIDDTGTTIVGRIDAEALYAATWTADGSGGWTLSLLPRSTNASGGRAYAIATAADGTQLVAGQETQKTKNTSVTRAAVWRKSLSTGWQQTLLPLPAGVTDGSTWAEDINPRGQVVGITNSRSAGLHAVLWDSAGSIAFVGPTGSSAYGINTAGNVIVGYYNSRAVYWKYENGAWTGPIVLPGTCKTAWAVDDNGNITASDCGSGATRRAAVFLATDQTMIQLGGLGPGDADAGAQAMSRSGNYIAGSSNTLAAYWQLFLF